MGYSIEQVKKGLGAYLDSEFMPLIEGDFKRVMVGAGLSIAISKYANMIPLLAENQYVKPLELFDEHGNVDLDTLYAAIQGQMSKDGFSINVPTIGPIRFQSEDVKKLYDTIRAQK